MNGESFLIEEAFFSVNKKLLRYLEGDTVQAIVLTELMWLAQCFKETDQMKYSNGWFFRSVADLEHDTCISYHKQKVAIEKLEDRGFIKTRLAGNPAKRHFKVCSEYIYAIIHDSVAVPEEEILTETKQDKFYRELNDAVTKGFDIFKTKIDHLKKPFAVFIYTWNRLYFSTSQVQWKWSPQTLGTLNMWYNRKVKSDVDFSRLHDFFQGNSSIGIDPEKYINMWIKYDGVSFEKAPSERILDPQRYWR